MLIKLTVRNFKRFGQVDIELGNPVVFIGPNNSGKTSALQALSLWELGIRKWFERRGTRVSKAKERIRVTVNRKDVLAAPIPNSILLWRNLHVREGFLREGERATRNVRIDLVVEGVSADKPWQAGLEFDYANEESFLVRPLRIHDHDDTPAKDAPRMEISEEASKVNMAFLPPMSGLAAQEFRKERGEINVLIGEGRTAEVLRNLCYLIWNGQGNGRERWQRVCQQIDALFGVKLEEPRYLPERSEIEMSYCDRSGIRLDLSSAGRGLQQTLLLLAYLEANPASVLLLDEPDAHLEILRQRQIYQILTESARNQGSQIIAASHSEVILNEAADRDVVVAFVGEPHRIDDRGFQVVKALKELGFEQYYQAEQTGWVLYLEGSTDLAILRALAEVLHHPIREVLERPFVHYIANQPARARDHFRGLREAKRDLVGFTLCDHLERALQSTPELQEYMWRRREIENYLCQPETLLAWAEASGQDSLPGPLFAASDKERRHQVMQQCIEEFVPRAAQRNADDRWWLDTRASEDFLDRLFALFFEKCGLPNLMTKTNYHVLVRFVPAARLDPEVQQVLDLILGVARRAIPRAEEHEP
jgi:predicted ATPase